MTRPGTADDRDDSSKTTPATDLQADDDCSPQAGGDPVAGGPSTQGGQAQGERREQDPGNQPRREQGPSEARARGAMKQEGRTGEGR